MSNRLISRRHDGTLVAEIRGMPYHIIESDEPLWSFTQQLAQLLGDALPTEEAPPPELVHVPTLLNKLEWYKRMTDEEVDAVEAALASDSISKRVRRMHEHSPHLDTNDEHYSLIRKLVEDATSKKRAKQILEPTH